MAEQVSQFGPGTVDLRLEEGECVILSPDSARWRDSYRQVRPRTIDEVRSILGLSGEAAKAAQERMCCPHSAVSARLVPAEDLTARDDATRLPTRALAYAASREYVRAGDPAYLAQWKPVLNSFLEVTKAVLNIALLQDIDVANGATLTISGNTHALYARNVRIYGSGRIVCQGYLTFKINSLEGVRRLVETGGIVSATALAR